MGKCIDPHVRFLDGIARPLDPDACWSWLGSTTKGYGYFSVRGQATRVHRFAYEWIRGPIPAGKQIDHLCRNRGCANPYHLQVVTSKENTMRGKGPTARHARKTHCDRGHPLTGSNVRIRIDGRGRQARECLACKTLRNRRRVWGSPKLDGAAKGEA